jgi:hypothetical protein
MKGGSLAPAQCMLGSEILFVHMAMHVCLLHIYIYLFEELEIHDRVDMLINYDYDYECFNLFC